MLFDLGQLVMTRGVAIRQEEEPYFGRHVMAALLRYMEGDWGEMDYGDKKMNDMAIGPNPERIFAAYEHPHRPEWKIWMITEADRSATTILFPDEY